MFITFAASIIFFKLLLFHISNYTLYLCVISSKKHLNYATIAEVIKRTSTMGTPVLSRIKDSPLAGRIHIFVDKVVR